MPYSTAYCDLVYPVGDASAAVCRYRVVIDETEPPRAIVQIEPSHGPSQPLLDSHNVRDAVVNRILDQELIGIPIDAIVVVITVRSQHTAIPISADIEDFVERGNRHRVDDLPGRGRRVHQRISIESRDIVAGRVRVNSAHAKPVPLAPEFAALLDGARRDE